MRPTAGSIRLKGPDPNTTSAGVASGVEPEGASGVASLVGPAFAPGVAGTPTGWAGKNGNWQAKITRIQAATCRAASHRFEKKVLIGLILLFAHVMGAGYMSG
jgi:hypothetical protein